MKLGFRGKITQSNKKKEKLTTSARLFVSAGNVTKLSLHPAQCKGFGNVCLKKLCVLIARFHEMRSELI